MRLNLESDVKVVGEVSRAAEAMVMALLLRPSVILMDVEMPDMDGIQAVEALRLLAPDTRVVVLTIRDDEGTRRRAIEAGAWAFVSKHDSFDVLLATLRRSNGRAA